MRLTPVVRLLALGTVAISALAACGSSSNALGGGQASPDKIIIGSANFAENELLADIYAGALTKAGASVSTKLNIGSREVYLKALDDGSINVLPEYTGALLSYYDKSATQSAPADVYSALGKALPPGLALLEYSQAEDKDSLAVTQQVAQQYKLKSMADLAPVCGQLTLGGGPEFQTRQQGVVGIKSVYGCTFRDYKSYATDTPLLPQALVAGEVQVANIFTTDPSVAKNKFVVLDDPKSLFSAQNVVPLYKGGALSQPAQDALNKVSKALTTADLATLVQKIKVDQMPAADVAAGWLKDKNLG